MHGISHIKKDKMKFPKLINKQSGLNTLPASCESISGSGTTHRHVIMERQFQSQDNPFGLCGGRCGTGTFSFRSTSISFCVTPVVLPTKSSNLFRDLVTNLKNRTKIFIVRT